MQENLYAGGASYATTFFRFFCNSCAKRAPSFRIHNSELNQEPPLSGRLFAIFRKDPGSQKRSAGKLSASAVVSAATAAATAAAVIAAVATAIAVSIAAAAEQDKNENDDPAAVAAAKVEA